MDIIVAIFSYSISIGLGGLVGAYLLLHCLLVLFSIPMSYKLYKKRIFVSLRPIVLDIIVMAVMIPIAAAISYGVYFFLPGYIAYYAVGCFLPMLSGFRQISRLDILKELIQAKKMYIAPEAEYSSFLSVLSEIDRGY